MNGSIELDRDKAAIIEILNLYGFLLDGQAWEGFDRVFTPDVTADFGPAGAVWPDRDALVRAFAFFHEKLENHQHKMMGHLVHVEGDTAYAFSYGDWLLVGPAAKGDLPWWLGTGWYDDELVRTENGWRIRHRIARLVSWTGNPYVPEPDYDTNSAMGTYSLAAERKAGNIRYYAKSA